MDKDKDVVNDHWSWTWSWTRTFYLISAIRSHFRILCDISVIFNIFNVIYNQLPQKRHSYIGFICLTFFRCEFSNVSSNCLPEKRHSCICCICLTFLHCVLSNVSSKSLDLKRQSHIIGCICSNFSTVRFQMCPQIACLRRGIVTLVAFV